jgi:hypothetical protein
LERSWQKKTQQNDADVDAFLKSVVHDVRRSDAVEINQLMHQVSRLPAMMWGASIVGFGEYHYKYQSGREGDCFRVGFSPRKQNLVIYIMPGYSDHSEILARLSKHIAGKSCVYINKLADIDLDVLKELIIAGLADMKSKYPK